MMRLVSERNEVMEYIHYITEDEGFSFEAASAVSAGHGKGTALLQ